LAWRTLEAGVGSLLIAGALLDVFVTIIVPDVSASGRARRR